jgi:hypothetical protein
MNSLRDVEGAQSPFASTSNKVDTDWAARGSSSASGSQVQGLNNEVQHQCHETERTSPRGSSSASLVPSSPFQAVQVDAIPPLSYWVRSDGLRFAHLILWIAEMAGHHDVHDKHVNWACRALQWTSPL